MRQYASLVITAAVGLITFIGTMIHIKSQERARIREQQKPAGPASN